MGPSDVVVGAFFDDFNALKLVGGTILFCVILWIARNSDRRAAGMMLTFPTLNGLVLLTATGQNVVLVASAIPPMMATNALLCAVFIVLYRAPAARFAGPRVRAVMLTGAGLCLWAGVAWLLDSVVERALGIPYAVVAGVSAVIIVLMAVTQLALVAGSARPEPVPTRTDPGVIEFLRRRWLRILLFFASFAAVLLVAHHGRDAHALVGRLSALPLIPFFVLATLAIEDANGLDAVASTALAGPLAALLFVVSFSLLLWSLRSGSSEFGWVYWLVGSCGLLVLWLLTGLAIQALAAYTRRVRFLSPPTTG